MPESSALHQDALVERLPANKAPGPRRVRLAQSLGISPLKMVLPPALTDPRVVCFGRNPAFTMFCMRRGSFSSPHWILCSLGQPSMLGLGSLLGDGGGGGSFWIPKGSS